MNLSEGLARHRHKVLPTVLLALGIALAFAYRAELRAWFGLPSGVRAVEGRLVPSATVAPPTGAGPAQLTLPRHAFDDLRLARLREGFAAYEAIRAGLAHDDAQGISAYAEALGQALLAAKPGAEPLPNDVDNALTRGAKAATDLGPLTNPEAARRPFGELSEVLVALGASDPRLSEGLHIFECPMAEGYQKWFQPAPKLDNPYMGESMSSCGEHSDWAPTKDEAAPAGASASLSEQHTVAHYTCSMHPSVKQQTPGKCPICGMDLTPVTRGEVESGAVLVDEARRQRIGVRTDVVSLDELTLSIRAVGEVVIDETGLFDVNLRMSGWVQELLVNKTGQWVRRGQTLFTLYSPELYAAQLEFLTAVRRRADGPSATFEQLGNAARQRLRLLGMSEAQVDEIERRGEASEQVPIVAPASGNIIEKQVVEGARVEAGALVYRIADMSRVWIDADVYESDLPHVKTGQPVKVRLPHLPDALYDGKVDFIHPTLDGPTRTGRVRVVLKNAELVLKPDMYADVEFDVNLGERLSVPESAVVYSGPRRLVFVDLGEGKLRPQLVELGAHVGDRYEVKSGLAAGDIVVTSGNFLIAAESRIRSATEYWESSHDPK